MSPDEPDKSKREGILDSAQCPVAEWLRAEVDRRSRRGLCGMRCQRNTSAGQRGDHLPFRTDVADRGVGQQGTCRRPDYCVNRIPDTVDVRDLVRHKFNKVNDCGCDNYLVGCENIVNK